MKASVQDITKMKVEVIVNAANGRGPMGAGVAGAIGTAGGWALKKEVSKICSDAGGFKEGDCYISGSGDLSKRGIQNVYHAVTMEYPGGLTSLEFVRKALFNTLEKAVKNGVKSIAVPGLGTGIGGLDPQSVARVMVETAKLFDDRIDITICDIDDDFIDYVNQYIEPESTNE